MGKLDKATDFYLRGFKSEYIKRRTGISIQSLLKQLKAKGVMYTKQDIIAYQIQYIQNHFTLDDVAQAYVQMSEQYVDLYKAQKHKDIVCLGCCFGNYKSVFVRLLGSEKYSKLRNDCWKRKQIHTVQEKYGVDNVFCKDAFAHFVSDEAVSSGREKRQQTMLDKYGVLEPNQNREICHKMRETLRTTMREKYGVDNAMQLDVVAAKSALNRQESMLKKYGARNSVEVPEIREKIFKARNNNGTLNSSFAEDALYGLLVDKFGVDSVWRNVVVDNRYPYHVDFYIVPRDMFIELNGDKCHYTHWFDCDNISDVHVVESWWANAKRLESENRGSSRYRKYIKTWTETDVLKRMCARKNQLNYLVFWDGSTKKKGSHMVACLSDAHEWLDAGCPDSWNWNSANTY